MCLGDNASKILHYYKMVLCTPLRCHVHCYSNQELISAGDVVLKDLKLKAEALNALKLPVTVKAGFVGTITLKVAFSHLPLLVVYCQLLGHTFTIALCLLVIYIRASLCVLYI